MSTLTGQSINTSYQGLLKTEGNGAIPAVGLTPITDGIGTKSGLQLGNTGSFYQTIITSDDVYTNGFAVDGGGTTFGGSVDFSGATVSGLTNTTYDLAAAQDGSNVDITLTGSDASVDTVQLTAGTNITLTETGGNITIDAAGGGAPGLVSGTGTGSMKSDAALTPIGANASGTYTVALGNNARATADESVGIGHYSNASGAYSIAMGGGAFATAIHSMAFKGGASASGALAIGWDAGASGQNSIAFGKLSTGNGIGSVGIGDAAKARADYSVCIGPNALVDDSVRVNTVVIGKDAKAAQYSISLGANSFAIGDNCATVGTQSRAAGSYASVIGCNSFADYNYTTAVGAGVIAINWTDSVTMKQLALISTGAYADDTAAAAGGVPINGVYHSSGALRIRLT